MSRTDRAIRTEFYGGVAPTVIGNVGAAPAVDASQNEAQTMVLTANATIAAPSGTSKLNPGDVLFLVLIQDATGTRTVAWNAAWRNAPSLSAGTAAQRASVLFRWDGANFQFIGGAAAFA